MSSSCLDNDSPLSYWIEINICRIDMLAVNNHYMQCWQLSLSIQWLLWSVWDKCQHHVNDFCRIHSAINGLNSNILTKWKYLSSLLVKRKVIPSLPHPRNHHQKRVNEFWSWIWYNCRAVQQHEYNIKILSHFLATMLAIPSELSCKQQCQKSFKKFWSCILHYARAVQQHNVIPNVLALVMDNNIGDSITTTS